MPASVVRAASRTPGSLSRTSSTAGAVEAAASAPILAAFSGGASWKAPGRLWPLKVLFGQMDRFAKLL